MYLVYIITSSYVVPKTLTAGRKSCYFFPLKAVDVTEHPQRVVQFSSRELKDLLI